MSRIKYFDIAKGIAILAVIIGHCALKVNDLTSQISMQAAYRICFSFHMPFFFILSGYFMHPERSFRWIKESKQLLCTYLLSSSAVLVGVTCLGTILHEDRAALLRSWIGAVIYGSGDLTDRTLWPVDQRIGAIWFLLALFWARFFLHCLAKLPCTSIWIIFCFAVGYISSNYVWLPWSIQAGMCAVAFLYLGYLAKGHNILQRIEHAPCVWGIAFIIWVIDVIFFGGMSMAANDYGSRPVLSVIGSIAGTICVVGISQLLEHAYVLGEILSRIGQASLAILCVHLVEDDVLPWEECFAVLQTLFPHAPLVFVGFIVRLPIDLCGAALLYYIPKINEWFYPQLAKKTQMLHL